MRGMSFRSAKRVISSRFKTKSFAELYRQAGFEKIQDWTAAKVVKKTPQGTTYAFTIFLVAGYKK